ncbi:MAG: hypothetical protein E6R09_09840 [Rhodocyclaceae bacterium]|nr:MAG: hypothetical protein E6R09_09840 [Rhodocyclaceae bacterium]
MSGPVLVAASGDVFRLTAATQKPFAQRRWFDESLTAAKQFAKGEYDGPAAMLLDVALGMVPVIGQAIDARDIILGLIDVSDQPNNYDAYFNLITAFIGVVPGGGDALKRALRSVKRGGAPAEDLLSMLRGLGKGNVEKLVLDTLDFSKIQPHIQTLTATLKNNRFVEGLDTEVRQRVMSTANRLEASLSQHFKRFAEEVKGWLKKQPNNSAEADYVSKKVRKQGEKPDAKGDTASQAKEHSSFIHGGREHIFYSAVSELSQRRIFFKGVLGEHMADYWVIEQGWASGWQAHDWGMDGKWGNPDPKGPRKLNDRGAMTPLWPLIPRGRGIDALWRTNGKNGKPYAVIEAKTYTNPATSLGQMLGDTQDKQEYEDYRQKKREWEGKSQGAGGKGGKRSKRSSAPVGVPAQGTQSASAPPQKPEPSVMQMSETWIRERIRKATSDPLAQADLRHSQGLARQYTRHVVLFSTPDIYEHSIAVFKHVSGEGVQDSDHANHNATRVFGESDLIQEEQRRKSRAPNPTGTKK